jgi:hypothetical protein
MAEELQLNLNEDFTVCGMVNPGSDLAVILNSVLNEIEKLSKNDVVFYSKFTVHFFTN